MAEVCALLVTLGLAGLVIGFTGILMAGFIFRGGRVGGGVGTGLEAALGAEAGGAGASNFSEGGAEVLGPGAPAGSETKLTV